MASSAFTARLVRFFYLVVLARFLEPAEIGIYAYGMAVYMALMGLSVFGQAEFLAIRIGRKRRGIGRITAHSLSVRLLGIAVAASGGTAYILVTERDPTVLIVVAIFLLALVVRSLAMWARECAVALEDTRWIPRYELIFRGGEFVLGTAALAAGGGLLAVCLIHLAAWSLEAVMALRALYRRDGIPIRFGRRWRLIRRIISRSWVLTLTTTAIAFFPQIGLIVLRQIQPDTATIGFFSIALQIVATALILPTALASALVPGMARASLDESKRDLRALTLVVKLILLSGLLGGIFAADFGVPVLTTLFGDRYIDAGETFTIIGWSLGPYAAAMLLLPALVAMGQPFRALTVALVMAGLHMSLPPLLISFGPLFAAAISLIGATVAGCALSAVFLGRSLGRLGLGWWLWPLIVTALFATAMQMDMFPQYWASAAFCLILLVIARPVRLLTLEDVTVIRKRLSTMRSRDREGRAKPNCM